MSLTAIRATCGHWGVYSTRCLATQQPGTVGKWSVFGKFWEDLDYHRLCFISWSEAGQTWWRWWGTPGSILQNLADFGRQVEPHGATKVPLPPCLRVGDLVDTIEGCRVRIGSGDPRLNEVIVRIRALTSFSVAQLLLPLFTISGLCLLLRSQSLLGLVYCIATRPEAEWEVRKERKQFYSNPAAYCNPRCAPVVTRLRVKTKTYQNHI